MIIDRMGHRFTSQQQYQLTDITPWEPEGIGIRPVVKSQSFRDIAVPPSQTLIFHPFGIGKLQFLGQMMADIFRKP
jgi:hypothetical protein